MENAPCRQLCRHFLLAAGNQDLPHADVVEHEILTPPVELAQHVVEQQHRVLPAVLVHQLAFGELEHQRAGAHLALRAEPGRGGAVDLDQDIVLMAS